MGGKKKKPGKKSSKKSGNNAETGSHKSHSELGDSSDDENEGVQEPQSTESAPTETVPAPAAQVDEAAELAAAVAASAAADPAPVKTPDPPPAPAEEKPPFEGTDEEIEAAKKIQALHRGKLARKQVKELKAVKAPEPKPDDAKDLRAEQNERMLEMLRKEMKSLHDTNDEYKATIKEAKDAAAEAKAELSARTAELEAKLSEADAKVAEEHEKAERLEHQVEAFDKSAASAVGSATNERKAKVEAELQRDAALADMEKEKAKANSAVAEAAKKIAEVEAKTAEERSLYDATMKRAHSAEERVRESKESQLAMRAGLIRMETVMSDSREIRDFMRAMRAAEESSDADAEGLPGDAGKSNAGINESSVAASEATARLVASNDERAADDLVDDVIHKLHHFLSVNADEKKELRAQVYAQQRFSKDPIGVQVAGIGGIGRSAALSPTSPRSSNAWKQPWERSNEVQSPGAAGQSALSPMAKDIAMMDMSELRTELERSRRYTTRMQTRLDKVNVEVTHQANMTMKAIEERDEAVAMLLAKAKSEEGAREDSENRARQLRAEIAQLKTDLAKMERRFKELTPLDKVVADEFASLRKATDAARRADPNAGPPATDEAVTASAVETLTSRLTKATLLEKECADLRKINAFLRRQGGSLNLDSTGDGVFTTAVESVMKESEDVIAALNRDGVKAEEVPNGSNTEKWRQVAMAFSGSLGKGSPPPSPSLTGVLPPPPLEGDDDADAAPMSAAEVARSMDSLRSAILKPGSQTEPAPAPGVVTASYSTSRTFDSPHGGVKTITRPDTGSAIKVRSVHQLRQTHTGGTFAPPRELFRGSPYSARNSPKPHHTGPKPWDLAADRVVPASERRDPGPEWFQDARSAWDSYTEALSAVEAQRELEKEKKEYAKYESLVKSGYNAAEPMRLPAHLRVKDALTSEAEVDRAVKRFVKTLSEHGASVSLRRNGPCKYMLSRTLTSAAQRGGRVPTGPAPASKIVMLRMIANRLVVHRGTNLPPLDLLDAVARYVQPYKPPGPVRKVADGLGRTKKWLESWTGKQELKSPVTEPVTSPKPVDFSQMTRERYPEDETVPPVPRSPVTTPGKSPGGALPSTPPVKSPDTSAPGSNTPTGPRPFLRVEKAEPEQAQNKPKAEAQNKPKAEAQNEPKAEAQNKPKADRVRARRPPPRQVE
jgi:hypothetical protein